jgi:hypothetical protein
VAVFWGLDYDYALQMAHSNFSGTMFHLGGQDIPSLEMDPGSHQVSPCFAFITC